MTRDLGLRLFQRRAEIPLTALPSETWDYDVQLDEVMVKALRRMMQLGIPQLKHK
ncbi:hypothetical protein ACQYD3_004497 [Enterobacter hormaechei]|uniref:hypothetical protein n=1 Tax=Enterobacter hormaechei TaxID=158836 RepID=UPI001BD5FF7D|nr:hypothetical protein [Enterobacter hormaechei]EKK5499129.1 hypothetical protein [Enterobacter hormaechei]EKK5499325.1 hypothetical protein [Enterobacter hormaechei]EKS6384958.1 hypothetical protein [Enterobacter hormaechei]ELD3289874.1 hypothetical protein [Enterobacter hormaechei]